ncbi:MAG: NAD(P)-dependent alcohol dehydrogenase [Pseudomonadota bacterium]|nr:NAD(P)-dependent alcohol dehydrogenase [Pseudomonadota bacterium]MEC8378153.1 NAD(P)-dependent alcohol dehydrogenase [Pseudomonadota bacterium]
MKQIQLSKPGGLENLKLTDTENPSLKDNEVLLKVHASSLNYHDLMVALGLIPTEDKRVPLSDAAGEILEVGKDVSKWTVGDKVMSMCFPNWVSGPPKYNLLSFIGDNQDGYATELISIPESAITKIPSNLNFKEAATLPCAGLTAWRALVDEGRLKSGETVLVQGTGGVSVFALQLAKTFGATVIATSSSEEKLEKLKSLGADHLINYKAHPEWGKEVLKITNNEGVDHVVEVGGAGTFSESVRCTKLAGHIALIGVLSGPSVSEIILPRIFLKQIRLSGIAMANQDSQIAMIDYLEKNEIKPEISDSFDLKDLGAAFQHQIDNKHFGKISIDIG